MSRYPSSLEAVARPLPPIGEGDQPPGDLVAAIYDAALDPRLWPGVLAAIARFAGGHSAAIFRKDLTGRGGGVLRADGAIRPDFAASYFRDYAPLDPTNTAHVNASVDQVVLTADVIDRQEFLASRLWLEWSRPQGIVDMVVAPIERQGRRTTLFGVFRLEEHGLGDEDVARRMGLVVPHVRRAFLIDRTVDRARLDAASFADTLDGLAAAVLLVDDSGQVVHANRAGLAFAGASRPDAGRMALADRAGGRELVKAVAEAVADREGRGRSLVLDADDGHVVHILPLTAGTRRLAGARYDAAAALFVLPASRDVASAPEVVARTFDLTPGELRVLLSIIDSGGVLETAEALGIGEATVKTHLHRIFGKTETRRQADLVRLMAAFASPFAH